jgi:hypothetical protein
MHMMAPWTDDLITQGLCKDGNRVLDLIPPPRVGDGVTEHREIAWEKVSDV